jgi:hypothetical protein
VEDDGLAGAGVRVSMSGPGHSLFLGGGRGGRKMFVQTGWLAKPPLTS